MYRGAMLCFLLCSGVAHGATRLRERADQCLIQASADGDLAEKTIAELHAEPGISADAGASAMLRLCELTFENGALTLPTVETQYEAILAEGVRLNDQALQASTLFVRGIGRAHIGMYPAALSDLNAAYTSFQATNNVSYQTSVMNALANVYSDRNVGDYEDALPILQKLLDTAREAGDLSREAVAEFNIGNIYNNQEKPDLALVHYRSALTFDLQRNAPADELSFDERSIAMSLSKSGRHVEALAQFDHAMKLAALMPSEDRIAMLYQARGAALRRAGRYREALSDLDRALGYFQHAENLRFLIFVHDDRALALAGLKKWPEAYNERVAQLEVQKTLERQTIDQQTALLRVQFQTQQQKQQNQKLSEQNEYQRRELEATRQVKRWQLAALVLSLMILFGLSAFTAAQLRRSHGFKKLAFIDSLTGLNNRRRFTYLFSKMQQGIQDDALYLLMIDVDDFKSINDTQGHDVGDETLKLTAAVIARISANHLCGRLGGEEFAVVFKGDSEALHMFASSLVTDVRTASPSATTISIGIAKIEENIDMSVIYKRADVALYQAKINGKNQYAQYEKAL